MAALLDAARGLQQLAMLVIDPVVCAVAGDKGPPTCLNRSTTGTSKVTGSTAVKPLFEPCRRGLAEAAEQFAELHYDYPEDPCVAFHCQHLAAGEAGTLIVMTEK